MRNKSLPGAVAGACAVAALAAAVVLDLVLPARLHPLTVALLAAGLVGLAWGSKRSAGSLPPAVGGGRSPAAPTRDGAGAGEVRRGRRPSPQSGVGGRRTTAPPLTAAPARVPRR